jgi:hypothetical protein
MFKKCISVVALITLLFVGTAFAQAPAAPPVVNLSSQKIVQISLVVKDIQKVAKRFSDVFGNSWNFYDFRPKQIVLYDKPLGDVDTYLKVALASIGGRSIKLVQPISGPSSYMDYLNKSGEGFYTMGLGTLANHDEAVAALKKAGVAIEMQGSLGNLATFTILDLVADAGCRIEFNGRSAQSFETNMQLTGSYVPDGPSMINMERPLFAGGKRFTQVGIVVKDEKKAAKRLEDLFGIKGWNIAPISKKSNAYLNEKLLTEAQMPALQNDAAMGMWGDVQLEILRPFGLGPSCHQDFLDQRGNGIQHLSFSQQADCDDVVDALKRGGINSEYSATLGGTSTVNYLDMEGQMGGFQLEITKSTTFPPPPQK